MDRPQMLKMQGFLRAALAVLENSLFQLPEAPIPDTTKPTLTLSANALAFSNPGEVVLTAIADDNVKIERVTFYRDGLELGSVENAPYVWRENIGISSNGKHKYKAIAVDTAGLTEEDELEINVTIASGPQITEIKATPNPVTAAGRVALLATVANGSAAGHVDFYEGTRKINRENMTPWESSFDLAFADNGTRTYQARVYDRADVLTSTRDVQVTVNIPAPPSPPSAATLTNDGDAFTLNWPSSTSNQYVVYSAYAATDRMFAPISPWVQGTTFRDPNVYDGVAVWYQVWRLVNGIEVFHAEVNGVQPERIWEDPAQLPPGRYVGRRFRSLTPGVRAFKTTGCSPTQLYDFEDCSFASVYHCIHGWFARVKMRGVRMWGLMPEGADKSHGSGFAFEQFRHLDVEYCYFENIKNNYLTQHQSTGAPGDTMHFNRNFARNIMGQKTDGAGGYREGNTVNVDFTYSQVLQLAKCKPGITGDPNSSAIRGGQIIGNYSSNEANWSRVEDNYSDYQTFGYPDSKIQMTDNLVDGAFPYRPTVHTTYSGGGYMVGDEGGNDIEQNRNIAVRYTNYGGAIMNGVGNISDNGRYVRSPYLWNGQRMTIAPPTGLVAMQFWDYNRVGAGMHDNSMKNNYLANQYQKATGDPITNNSFVTVNGKNGNVYEGNTEFKGLVTVEMEWAEVRLWRDRLAANSKGFGPQYAA
ncbi:Ig-like domain-containing protein [Deinococcus frigens]|uniref:Ig-like domain-containing protein n=1 Tax=Deinococcus frigens TaxID=249403 RepID=UPI00049860CF|nr:Ig-like domain-containing protein [Deinococcus frigens]